MKRFDPRSLWYFGNRYCGAEAVTVDGGLRVMAVTAKKKKGEFTDLGFHGADGFSGLAQKLGAGRHLFLTINTDKVLVARAEGQAADATKAASRAFPGIDLSDFYHDILFSQDHCYVAVCRKKDVGALLEMAEVAKLKVVGFRLGFSGIRGLLPFLEADRVVLNREVLEISDGKVSGFSPNDQGVEGDYTVDGTTVGSGYLLSLSSLFGYIDRSSFGPGLSQKNAELESSFKGAAFFRKGLMAGTLFVFLVLLLNFYFFMQYRDRYQQLSSQVQVASSKRESLAKRAEGLEVKERIVKGILESSGSRVSFYANRVLEAAPTSISFGLFEYQPITKGIRPDSPISYQGSTIVVAGQAREREGFSQWLDTIGGLSWVSGVTVLEYGSEKSGVDGFEIEIALHGETGE